MLQSHYWQFNLYDIGITGKTYIGNFIKLSSLKMYLIKNREFIFVAIDKERTPESPFSKNSQVLKGLC